MYVFENWEQIQMLKQQIIWYFYVDILTWCQRKILHIIENSKQLVESFPKSVQTVGWMLEIKDGLDKY